MFSSVGGGPLDRMTEELKRRQQNAKSAPIMTPEQWRSLFSRGTIGRMTARALTFGGYPLQTLFEAVMASMQAKPLEKATLVVTTNPFFLPHFLVATKPIHRCGIVALMYDMYPDALEAAGIEKKWLSKFMTMANRWMLKRADGVVYLGDVMKESAEKRYGTNPNTWIIPNGASQDEFVRSAQNPSVLPSELTQWMDGKCIFSYVGNMGLMHDVETLEKAVPALIASLSDEDRKKFAVIIASSGPGEARLRKSWADLTDYVRFIGPQKDDAWAELLVKTTVALATLTNEAFATSAPSKIYSAVASHCIPLAVCPDHSDLASYVSQCGFIVEPGNSEKLAKTMAELIHLFHANELESSGEETEQFADLMKRVLATAEETDIPHIGQMWMDCFDAIAENLPKPWKTAIYHAVKRGFDVASVSAGLAVIWPVLAITALAVKKHLGDPILFRQQRPGIDGKPFELLKFRSMANAPEGTDASHDGERLSDFGKKIRAMSLDELPTLLNVLKGDMSLVGPRPLLMSYLDRYNDEQMKRQWVKPGITGWAQVNGRNALSWKEKFDHDTWYVENASILLDLKILFMTAATVLKRSGIQHADSATMPEFMGNEA